MVANAQEPEYRCDQTPVVMSGQVLPDHPGYTVCCSEPPRLRFVVGSYLNKNVQLRQVLKQLLLHEREFEDSCSRVAPSL